MIIRMLLCLACCISSIFIQNAKSFAAVSEMTGVDLEFGVTFSGGTSDISSFQTGFDGAYYFGLEPSRIGYRGLGQIFRVSSDATLSGVKLRIGDFGNYECSGQFEIAVYDFDTENLIFADRIAYMLANAADYDDYDSGGNVPISNFDLSSFQATIDSSKTYALAVSPLDSFYGILTLQSQLNNYPGGHALSFTSPPHPPGDANCDYVVDLIDLGRVADNWGTGDTWAEGDLNEDGTVDLVDLGRVADNWGNDYRAVAAPEPGTVAMLIAGGLCLVGYRLRKRAIGC